MNQPLCIYIYKVKLNSQKKNNKLTKIDKIIKVNQMK